MTNHEAALEMLKVGCTNAKISFNQKLINSFKYYLNKSLKVLKQLEMSEY